MLPLVSAMLDKLAKRNIIHKNKAANLKQLDQACCWSLIDLTSTLTKSRPSASAEGLFLCHVGINQAA